MLYLQFLNSEGSASSGVRAVRNLSELGEALAGFSVPSGAAVEGWVEGGYSSQCLSSASQALPRHGAEQSTEEFVLCKPTVWVTERVNELSLQ